MPSQIQLAGGQPQKQPKYVPLFFDRYFTGLYTQRSVLHDPSSVIESKFYGGRPDALWMGSNIELTNRLTLQRRPGLTAFSAATYPTAPIGSYAFERDNSTIQVIIDCGTTGNLALSAVDMISGVAYYHFTSSQSVAANGAFLGWIFDITGFDQANNNGTFTCIGSTSAYLILENTLAVTDIASATAVSAGAVYYDPQGEALESYAFTTIENPLSDGGNFSAINSYSQPKVATSGLAEPSGTSAFCCTYYSGTTWPADQTSTITIAALSATGNCGPIVRANPGVETFYWVNLVGAAGTSQTHTLYALVAGTNHSLGTFTATVAVADEWMLQVQGETLTVYQNDNLMLTVVDSTYEASIPYGSPAFYVEDTSSLAGTQLSNWEGSAVKELLFAKNPGAGQTFFVSVAGILYMGDGVDTRKYVPDVTNLNPDAAIGASGQIWNWGGATPTTQPAVTITESGAAATPWSASTVFSTMGLLLDNEGHAELLVSINATGTNTSLTLGTSGSGQPPWVNSTGALLTDGTCHWTCYGPLSLWTARTTYAYDQAIFDPSTGWCFVSSGGTSGTAKPNFVGAMNHGVGGDGTISNWQPVGLAAVWQPSFTYQSFWEHNICIVCEPSIGATTTATAAQITAGLQPIYLQANNVQTTGSVQDPGTSGSGYQPAWPAGQTPAQPVGSQTIDGNLQWIDLGSATWLPATQYFAWTQGSTTFGVVEDPYGDFQVCISSGESTTAQFNGTLYTQWQASHSYTANFTIAVKNAPSQWVLFQNKGATGTSGSTEPTNWNFATGMTTGDGGVTWTCLGTIINSGVWGQTYGAQTTDGTVTWTNVGPIITWTKNTQWYLQKGGFAPPTSAQPYGGAIVIGGGDIQTVTSTGLSGTNQPSWPSASTTFALTAVSNPTGQVATYTGTITGGASNAYAGFLFTVTGFAAANNNGSGLVCVGSSITTLLLQNPNATAAAGASGTATEVPIGSSVPDGTGNLIWFTEAVFSANSLSWSNGYVYAYSYYARLADDPYNTSVAQGGFGPPPGWPRVLGTPTGAETGTMTTASPVFTILGSNAGAQNTLVILGSTDPQFDTIVIWRSADGGGADNMFFLTEIPMPPPINGVAQSQTFVDFLPDDPTSVFPGLNELISAPINDQNDPPPTGFLPMVYNFSRIWGADNQTMFNSGGPDIEAGQGNPNECFNPQDDYGFLASVTNARKCSQGIVVFLTDSIQVIAGGPATSSFYTVEVSDNIGLTSPNALDQYAGEIYFFAADSEFKIISVNLQLSNAGFPIGDKLANFNAANVYVAVQQAGVDNALYVTDGATGWYRCNVHQTPGGYSGPEPIWSPFANITNGCQMVQSIEVTPGIKKLLVGATPAYVAANGGAGILERNLGVYTDNGTMYDAFFVMGSIGLCQPGQLCILKFIEMDLSGFQYQPTVSYLLNEISGTFTQFTLAPQFDPPSLYGNTISPQSYSPNRYYFSGTGSLARARHMQLMVDFGETANGDEVYNVTIFGRLFVET